MARIGITLFIILAICSCKKDKEVVNPTQDLSGRWRWISTFISGPLSNTNPKTPLNTGIEEILEFNQGNIWFKIQNSVHIDSGTYSTGHGSYTPFPGAYVFIYDSIVYSNISSQVISHDYYKVYNDTLQFSPVFAGLYGGEAKFYIKQ